MVLDLVAEFVMGRVCQGPSLSWAEFVMGRDVPESNKEVWVVEDCTDLADFVAIFSKWNRPCTKDGRTELYFRYSKFLIAWQIIFCSESHFGFQMQG